MTREHRISAGAVVISGTRVLLVRYKGADHRTYLVGPGGGVLSDEGINQAVVREVREETGLEVSPIRILGVEDLLSRQNRIVKIWILCNLNGGILSSTQAAREEGIIEAGWYSKEQLQNEVVYPSFVKSCAWGDLSGGAWETVYLGPTVTDF